LAARPFLAQHDCTAIIEPDDVERVLANINADYRNRNLCVAGMACSLVWAPLTSLSLVGQEHGRTIPLTDIEAFSVRAAESHIHPSRYEDAGAYTPDDSRPR
jgi:hypothetical protein